MIVNELVKYYEVLKEDNEVPKHGWSTERIAFGIQLSRNGELLQLIDLRITEQSGKKEIQLPINKFVPERVVRSSGIKSNFLVDNAGYLLGIDKKGLEKFEDAKKLHLEILRDINNNVANSIKLFFENWNVEIVKDNNLLNPYIKDLEAGLNLMFLTEDLDDVGENEEIVKAWENYYFKNLEGLEQICLITGEKDSIARIHGKIKGVRGAQAAGANLISINSPSFYSYGIESCPSAPVGNYAMSAYVKALNNLISNNNSRQLIGELTVVFWSEDGNKKAQKLASLSLFPNNNQEETIDLKSILEKISRGEPIDDINTSSNFNILGVSPNAARISVSFFYKNEFGKLINNINEHYNRLEIVRPKQVTQPFLSATAILNETVNPKSKDKKISAQLSNALFKSIILGVKYPVGLYQSILTRIKSDQDDGKFVTKINWRKVAIIKAYLLQNLSKEEKEAITVALNENNTNRAYLLGRLFSILENIQESSNPTLNTTIKDRYFNSACATPGVVFPQLIKLSQSHIKIIKREKPGIMINLNKQMGSIMNMLDDSNPFPKHLNLEEQGLFILGYYQQTQDRYLTKEERKNGSN